MGQISKAIIKREKNWYNPFFLNFNGTHYEVKGYVLYNPETGEVLAEQNRGWFDESPLLSGMEYPEMEQRRKVDLTIKHPFFVSVKSDFNDKIHMAKAYIPAVVDAETYKVTNGIPGTSYKHKFTDATLSGGYKVRVRTFVETITTDAYDKREAIAKRCGIDGYTLNGILKSLKEEGYNVDDIISE